MIILPHSYSDEEVLALASMSAVPGWNKLPRQYMDTLFPPDLIGSLARKGVLVDNEVHPQFREAFSLYSRHDFSLAVMIHRPDGNSLHTVFLPPERNRFVMESRMEYDQEKMIRAGDTVDLISWLAVAIGLPEKDYWFNDSELGGVRGMIANDLSMVERDYFATAAELQDAIDLPIDAAEYLFRIYHDPLSAGSISVLLGASDQPADDSRQVLADLSLQYLISGDGVLLATSRPAAGGALQFWPATNQSLLSWMRAAILTGARGGPLKPDTNF